MERGCILGGHPPLAPLRSSEHLKAKPEITEHGDNHLQHYYLPVAPLESFSSRAARRAFEREEHAEAVCEQSRLVTGRKTLRVHTSLGRERFGPRRRLCLWGAPPAERKAQTLP